MIELNLQTVFGIDGLLVEVAWKSSVILAMAGLLHLLLRKRTPIGMAFGWNAVLVALLVLPFAAGIAPIELDYAAAPPFNSEASNAPVVLAGPAENVEAHIVDSTEEFPVDRPPDLPVSHATVAPPTVSARPAIELWLPCIWLELFY